MVQWQPGITLLDVERDTILKALAFYHGNKKQTAQAVGVSLRTLHTRLEEYKKSGIEIRYYNADTLTETDKETLRAAQKQDVSVRERKEVQEMPPASGGVRHVKAKTA